MPKKPNAQSQCTVARAYIQPFYTKKKKIMNPFQGWIGEKKTTFYLWLSLSKKSYYTFHNIILPSKNGTTQIDHLIISVFRMRKLPKMPICKKRIIE
jgi:hypothetical protein